MSENIVSLIGSVGFPIVMCIMLMYYIKTTQEKLIETMQNLTQAISRLDSRLDALERERE